MTDLEELNAEQELLNQRRKVKLPFDLEIDRVEDLLEYIADNLPCQVQYQINTHKTVGRYPGSDEDTPRFTTHQTLEGTIVTEYGDAPFKYITEGKGNAFFGIINFESKPGYTLEDTVEETPEKVGIWDGVREQVLDYFKG